MKDNLSHDSKRRQFLKGAAITISTIAVGPNLIVPAFAQAPNIDLDKYKPQFFNPTEWAFILAAVEQLIPKDEFGPSALEANVPVFIDMQMLGSFGLATDWYMSPPFLPAKPEMGYQSSLTPAQTYRKGIEAVNAYCQQNYQHVFAELTNEQKESVLTLLQQGKIELSQVSSSQFFAFLLQNTKEGYFSDPIHGGNKNLSSWTMIGFPGARASFKEWLDFPNVSYPLGPVSINGERG